MKVTETRFDRMTSLGDRLIEAQQLEECLGRVYAKSRTATDLEKWKEARQWVDGLAVDYTAAIREWREEIELQIPREAQSANRWEFTLLARLCTPSIKIS